MQLTIIPISFIVPILAGRTENQQVLVGIAAASFVLGIIGLLLNLPFTVIYMMLLGVGCGFAFSLAMMFFTMRTRTVQEASEVSGMAQSIGYALAAFGPLLFGFLRDITSSWTLPLIGLGIAAIIIFIAGMGAGREGFVSNPD